jgi:hypothetical protein
VSACPRPPLTVGARLPPPHAVSALSRPPHAADACRQPPQAACARPRPQGTVNARSRPQSIVNARRRSLRAVSTCPQPLRTINACERPTRAANARWWLPMPRVSDAATISDRTFASDRLPPVWIPYRSPLPVSKTWHPSRPPITRFDLAPRVSTSHHAFQPRTTRFKRLLLVWRHHARFHSPARVSTPHT